MASILKHDYPWASSPLIVSAPMRLIALAPLAVEVSKAGGFGFLGAGSDVSTLSHELSRAAELFSTANTALPTQHAETLPLGVGFLNWGADLAGTVKAFQLHRPAAVWFFAPRKTGDLREWSCKIRDVTEGMTKIWVQVGSVKEAVEVSEVCQPDVLVVQANDAGGHGRERGAGVVTLVPEVMDALESVVFKEGKRPVIIATGGIVGGRGVAAALALGASGVVMGTRYLASHEANIAKGYKDEVLRVDDGGQNTIRTKVYDQLRGTTDWPEGYNGRGVINRSLNDAMSGMDEKKNIRLYEEAVKLGDKGWGPDARMTTYAGTGVGLVRKVAGAGQITVEVREEARRIVKSLGSKI